MVSNIKILISDISIKSFYLPGLARSPDLGPEEQPWSPVVPVLASVLLLVLWHPLKGGREEPEAQFTGIAVEGPSSHFPSSVKGSPPRGGRGGSHAAPLRRSGRITCNPAGGSEALQMPRFPEQQPSIPWLRPRRLSRQRPLLAQSMAGRGGRLGFTTSLRSAELLPQRVHS